jgi:hypothetical protein
MIGNLKLIDDLLGDLEDLLDRAFIDEDRNAQNQLFEITRGASESVVSSCVLLRACRVGFGYFLEKGDIEKAEFYFDKVRTMIDADLLGSKWDQILIGHAQYRLLINKKNFKDAKEVASKLLKDINSQIGSIEHSLKYDFRS